MTVGLLGLLVLVIGGFVAARAVAHASNVAATEPAVRVVTTRQKVLVRVHGHLVTRWRTHKIYEKGQTVLETQTIHTPTGVRLVTRPVTRYRVVKHVVRVHGKTRTVVQPVTDTRTRTSTNTQLVTVTHQSTDTRTVTQPVTVVQTTTVVSTETQTETETVTVPITITVTLPTTSG